MNTNKNQSNNSEKSVAIFWDYENIPQGDIASDLFKFARQRGDFLILKAYSCQWNDKAKKHLEKQGFECIQVENPGKIKNAADFQLVQDCLNCSADIKIVVSGDCGIHKKLKQDKGKLIGIARNNSACQSFVLEVFDKFYYTAQLPELVKNIASEVIVTESYINYEDTVQCLLEAIKTAIKNKIDFTPGNFSQLMHDNPKFPNYQNVSSIRKPDGTKFSKFSQFLAKAIQEEMIPKVYQSILLANAR
ncbi:NYN domain-containing protein [Limnoraphis robusta]|uniref:NYN domain-containing protein n=1 Tax=Limnoraphis robusta CCNP1315 TaxID=3110306 RepID=A0ABU5U014_9CYAN|nr:NYN domain-containing protein [Limnoraphis robusta]MEA5497697.1 NYN domain-containing protein [Limnoraphis robusta BA-68 BA1]MEA5520524.1 NYN domain-containing protein [Limnoraphis robusta CCNP1315]MEA5547037.1 NYN domain-containing protein [Limnoraphis robusta CCNP1324]